MTYHHELITKVLHHCHQAGTIRTDIDLDIAAEMLHSMWEGTLYRAVSQNYTGDFMNQTKQSFQILTNSLKIKRITKMQVGTISKRTIIRRTAVMLLCGAAGWYLKSQTDTANADDGNEHG